MKCALLLLNCPATGILFLLLSVIGVTMESICIQPSFVFTRANVVHADRFDTSQCAISWSDERQLHFARWMTLNERDRRVVIHRVPEIVKEAELRAMRTRKWARATHAKDATIYSTDNGYKSSKVYRFCSNSPRSMKLSFCLVLSFSLVLASVIIQLWPIGWNECFTVFLGNFAGTSSRLVHMEYTSRRLWQWPR